jgi:hypothetical protein
MKRLVLALTTILLMSANWSAAQLYRTVFEAGDTIVSNTPDTSDQIWLYKSSADNRRPIRSTLFLDLDEVGTNTTHYWLQIDTYLAEQNADPDQDRWVLIHSELWQDFNGIGSSSQNNHSFAMPWLESYAGQYVHFVFSYPYGVAADSTEWVGVYLADESSNMYDPPRNYVKRIPHYNIWRTRSAKLAIGAANTTSDIIDFRIETSPGVYQMPDRAYLCTVGDGSKYDDDSLTVYIQGVSRGVVTSAYLDTLTVNIASGAADFKAFSFTPGFVDAVKLVFTPEAADAADTTDFYTDIILEADP